MRRWISLLGTLLLASSAGAADLLLDCDGSNTTNRIILRNYDRLCYEFDDSDTTASDSALFEVAAHSALVHFDPDTGATGVATATIKIRKCGGTTKPASSPENECIDLGGANGNAQLKTWPIYALGSSNVNGTAWISSQLATLEIAEPFVTITINNQPSITN